MNILEIPDGFELLEVDVVRVLAPSLPTLRGLVGESMSASTICPGERVFHCCCSDSVKLLWYADEESAVDASFSLMNVIWLKCP